MEKYNDGKIDHSYLEDLQPTSLRDVYNQNRTLMQCVVKIHTEQLDLKAQLKDLLAHVCDITTTLNNISEDAHKPFNSYEAKKGKKITKLKAKFDDVVDRLEEIEHRLNQLEIRPKRY